MAESTLNKEVLQVDDSLDGIVTIQALAELPGGRTLDVTGITDSVIKAGHIIVRDTATDVYKPLTITAKAYIALPTKHEYVGTLKFAIPTSDPRAAIVLAGVVNEAASPAPVTAAMKTALPGIKFLYGKAAS